MRRFGKSVIEETKDYNIVLDINSTDIAGTYDDLVVLGPSNIKYPMSIEFSTMGITFPHRLKIVPRSGSTLDSINWRELVDEMSEIFTRRAIEASNIVDYETFARSPGWYMFKPLINNEFLRNAYGVKMDVSKSLVKLLNRRIFYAYAEGNYSILQVLYMYKNVSAEFCNIPHCREHTVIMTSDRHMDNNPKKVTLYSPDWHLEAMNIAAEFGLPLVHDTDC